MAKGRKTTGPALPPIGNAARLLGFVETHAFAAKVAKLGLTDDDVSAMEATIRLNPEVGAVVVGTGGLRKFRFADTAGGRGKSGSYRTCYAYFAGPGLVLLVTIFGKGEKDNLDADEKAAARKLIAHFDAHYTGKGNP